MVRNKREELARKTFAVTESDSTRLKVKSPRLPEGLRAPPAAEILSHSLPRGPQALHSHAILKRPFQCPRFESHLNSIGENQNAMGDPDPPYSLNLKIEPQKKIESQFR